jgi:hypothetical protein
MDMDIDACHGVHVDNPHSLPDIPYASPMHTIAGMIETLEQLRALSPRLLIA